MADVNISKYRASVVRDGSKPASPGFVVSEGQDPVNPPGTNNFVPYTGATANVELGEFGLETGFVTLDTTPTNIPTEQGAIYWDDTHSTAALIMNGVIQHIGQDSYFYVKNSSGSSIAKGTAVRFDGTDGASGHIKIAPFLANGTYPSFYFMGVTAETIPNGAFGQVTNFGELDGINTSGYSAGDLLYASTSVAGAFQTTAPVAPNNIVLIAAAINSKNNGAIIVRPQIGSNINNDEGVKITSVANKDLLQYTVTAGVGLWENKTLAQVLGGNPITGSGTLNFVPKFTSGLGTIGNSSIQDNGSNITLGLETIVVGDISASNLSGTNTGNVTIGTANGLSLSGQILSLGLASGSSNGALSSTDWTTFNNKQNALTNPVTGTGTTNYLPKFTGSTTIGNSQVFDNGTNVGIGTANPDGTLVLSAGTNGTASTGGYLGFTTGVNNSKVRGAGIETFTTDSSNNHGLRFYTNNPASSPTVKMTLTDTGNLGLGVTPTNKLDVLGTAASPNLVGTNAYARFYQSGGYANVTIGALASGSFAGWIQTSDGVGTALPLSLQPNGGNLLVGTTTDNGARLQVSGGNVTITNSGNVFSTIKTTTNTGVGSYLCQNDINTTTEIGAWGSARSGFGAIQANNGYIFSGDELAIGASLALKFGVGGSNTERMRITSSGNVGIGTASPADKLHIANNGTGAYSAALWTNSNSTANLYVGVGGSGVANTPLQNNAYVMNAAASGLAFGTSDAVRMFITSGGNVLIGTATDGGARLRVNGDILIPADGRIYGNLATVTGLRSYLELYNSSTGNINLVTGFSTASIVFATQQGVERLKVTSDGTIAFNGNSNIGNGGYDKMSMGYLNSTYGWIQTWNSTPLILNGLGNKVLIGTTISGSSNLRIVGLPTSSSGLSSGDIWNDGGTLKIV